MLADPAPDAWANNATAWERVGDASEPDMRTDDLPRGDRVSHFGKHELTATRVTVFRKIRLPSLSLDVATYRLELYRGASDHT
jgi:hypothetical protein